MAAFLLDKGESTQTVLDPKKCPRSLLGPAVARWICQGRPVRAPCLRWALETGEPEGDEARHHP
ncbi:hypothetical protein [Nonomuraea sp. NPDC049695]|uniref:hypothetical protein n=1 Tax=Nonomuraea sp. NPDC049695 TaxID=3154734 RepID=UPI00341BB7F5